MFLGYIRRHHVGLLALFVALGGTSYAAVKLPRNSVGTAQIRSKAVTQAKLSTATVKALQGAKGDKGATGATGPAGANGANGANGAKGDPGAPATFSAAVSALSGASAPATTVPAASVTLQKPGKILVVVTGTLAVTCGVGGACSYEVGALLDGATLIGGTATTLTTGSGMSATKTVAIAGMIDAQPGTHQVALFDNPNATVSTRSVSTDTRVIAFAIG
jgi:hypothetical protein